MQPGIVGLRGAITAAWEGDLRAVREDRYDTAAGKEALAFIQESSLDRTAKRMTFKNVGEHPKVKKHLENSGTFTFRDLGGRTERTISGELKVTNLSFLLKPLAMIAEQLIYSNAQNLLNEEARVFAEFLKQRKPAAA